MSSSRSAMRAVASSIFRSSSARRVSSSLCLSFRPESVSSYSPSTFSVFSRAVLYCSKRRWSAFIISLMSSIAERSSPMLPQLKIMSR